MVTGDMGDVAANSAGALAAAGATVGVEVTGGVRTERPHDNNIILRMAGELAVTGIAHCHTMAAAAPYGAAHNG